MKSAGFKGATLGGCKIAPRKNGYIMVRDMRFSARKVRKAAQSIDTHEKLHDPFALNSMGHGCGWIWDNRFSVQATRSDWQTIALCALPFAGREITGTKKFKHQKQKMADRLKSLPDAARPSLPVHYNTVSGNLTFGEVNQPDFTVKSLLSQRLTDILFV